MRPSVHFFSYKKKSNKDKLSPQGAVYRSIFQIVSNQQKLDSKHLIFNGILTICFNRIENKLGYYEV